jgi:hypothetical protein
MFFTKALVAKAKATKDDPRAQITLMAVLIIPLITFF